MRFLDFARPANPIAGRQHGHVVCKEPGEGPVFGALTSGLLDGSDVVLEEAGTYELKGLTSRRQVFRLVISQRDDVPV